MPIYIIPTLCKIRHPLLTLMIDPLCTAPVKSKTLAHEIAKDLAKVTSLA